MVQGWRSGLHRRHDQPVQAGAQVGDRGRPVGGAQPRPHRCRAPHGSRSPRPSGAAAILKSSWDETLERYSGFWANRAIDRPLLIFDTVGSLANPMYRGVGYDYTRYGEDVASFRRDYLAVWEARRECRDDAVPCISPQLGGSTEAAFWAGELEWGAEVASLRPQYPLETAPRLESIRFDPTNRYYQRVLREIGFLSETAGQGYGVNFEANLSITTTISQLIGPERFLLGLYDEPEGIRALAEAIAGQILALLSHVCRAVPHPAGGTCHRWINYWNPGWGYWFSEDDAILLSPSFYERFFLDLDARLCAACDCAAVHWHSGALPLVGLLDRLPGLRMLQVSFDPNGPDLEQVIAACAGFARDGRKVCLQMGPDLDRIRDVLRRIDPGACMLYLSSAPSISAANDLADSVAGLCRRKPWT